MGIITGKWLLPSSSLPRAERVTSHWVANQLRHATGLQVEERDGVVSVPLLKEKLFDWVIGDEAVAVDGYAPAHPYLWENLDRIMIHAGCTCSEEAWRWRSSPTHSDLRKPWNELSARDRFLLSGRSMSLWRLFGGRYGRNTGSRAHG